MTNEQRNKALCFLIGHKDGRELSEQNKLRYDDDNWYIREDKLPVSRKDGSCSSINQRLIDPLIFNWLMERLPDYSELAEASSTWAEIPNEVGSAYTMGTTFKQISTKLKKGSDWGSTYGSWTNVTASCGEVVQ